MTGSLSNSHIKRTSGNIFLIGFMGSGKSHWGKIWAQQTGMTFYDLDDMVETKHGKSIAVIFEKEGESFFRELETIALHSIAEKEKIILACGGGAACFNNNMEWMNNNGITVYLSATPQYIFDHVIKEKNKRPLIKKLNEAELLFFIEQKLKEREIFYNQAKFILFVDELNEKSISKLNF